jgi:hypothetical protein
MAGAERERRLQTLIRSGWLGGAVLLILLITVQPFADGNAWWHLALGRFITVGGIPAHEPFSYIPSAHPWVGQQWLFDVLLAGMVGAGGAGLASASFGVLAAAAFVIAALAAPRSSRAGGAALACAMVLSGLVASRLLGVTPMSFSVLGLAVVLFALARWREGRAAAVWILPPLFLLWANIDTLFVAGLLIVMVTLLLTARSRHSTASRTQLGAAFAVSALVTLVNPYGPGLYAAVLTTLADPAVAQLTNALTSPDFHTWWLRLFEAEAALLVVAWVAGGGPDLVDVVIGFAAIVVSLWSEAYVAVFAIIAVPQLAVYGARAWATHVAPRLRAGLRLPGGRGPLALGATAIAVIAAVVVTIDARQLTPAAEASFDAAHYPVAASDFVAAHDNGQRLYTTDVWAGYLAYRFPTGRVVPLYDQGSTFGDAASQQYTAIHLLQNGWEQTLRGELITRAIVLDTSQEASALHELGWTIACRDPASASVVMDAPAAGATPDAASALTLAATTAPLC